MSDVRIQLDEGIIHEDVECHIVVGKKTSPESNLKNPVIVLFGWGGCRDKYLSKYSEIYENEGCTTVRCIVPSLVLFPGTWFEVRLQNAAHKVVDVMQNLRVQEHPVFFHAFSNGGCAMYNCVSQIIRSNPTYNFQIKGCIFDSAPAKIYAQNIIQAVVCALSGIKSNCFLKYLCAITVLTYIYTIAAFNWISSFLLCQQPSSKRFVVYEDLLDEPNICPQLFLYSKTDNICSYDSIQDFVNERIKKGVDVTTVTWDESEHVKHMISFREEYVGAILKFIGPFLVPKESLNRKYEGIS